ERIFSTAAGEWRFFLAPFLRGHSGGGEGTASATRLAIGGRGGPRAAGAKTGRPPHPSGLPRPHPPGPGGRAGESAPAGPDTRSCPGRWPVEQRRAHLPQGRGQLGTAHGGGGSSGDGFLLRGGSAGVGWALGWCLGTKPALPETASADLV